MQRWGTRKEKVALLFSVKAKLKQKKAKRKGKRVSLFFFSFLAADSVLALFLFHRPKAQVRNQILGLFVPTLCSLSVLSLPLAALIHLDIGVARYRLCSRAKAFEIRVSSRLFEGSKS